MVIGGTGRPIVGRIALPAGTEREIEWMYNSSWLRLKESADPSVPDHYALILKPDGSFRVEDVPAGTHEVIVRVYERPESAYSSYGDVSGSITMEFEVPEMPGGRSDEPLDLGTLELELRED